jgi:hypothetical protein
MAWGNVGGTLPAWAGFDLGQLVASVIPAAEWLARDRVAVALVADQHAPEGIAGGRVERGEYGSEFGVLVDRGQTSREAARSRDQGLGHVGKKRPNGSYSEPSSPIDSSGDALFAGGLRPEAGREG